MVVRLSHLPTPSERRVQTPESIASFSLAGDNSEEATPDPIPNSEVKLFCVDGTAWVTVWESRTSPAFFCPDAGDGFTISCIWAKSGGYASLTPRG